LSRHIRAPKPAPPQQQRYYEEEEAARIAQWPGYNDAGIRAWASAIPPGCGSHTPEALSYCPDVPRVRPEFPLSRQRPALPALCKNTTEPARTTYTHSPSASPIAASLSPRAVAQTQPLANCSVSSLVTALTESIATPDSPDAHAHASPARVSRPKPGVLENLTLRFRTRNGAPPAAPIPTLEIMKTTTTTTTTSMNSPNSPIESKKAQKIGASKNSTAGFTVLGTTHLNSRDEDDVFTYPFGQNHQAAFPDVEIKESLLAGKRGVWIAGRDGRTGCGYGPAYYEKGYLRSQTTYRAPLDLPLGSDRGRELELAAYKSRGRKPARP
ncbi:hypothetical protein EW145_g7357, partial [Phellinidium pouzarii]